jgi:glycosyltransferase involved in cell wall biosynthesis
MILLAHPTGNPFSRALLQILLSRGQLGLFATTIALSGRESWLKLLPPSVRSELLRREFKVPRERLLTRPFRELLRLARGRFGLSSKADPVYCDMDNWLAQRIPALTARHQLTGIYAYEDGAAESFECAQLLGLKCFYELPIAYWETTQRLVQTEAERWPEWKQTMPGLEDSIEKRARKTREAELADLIVCPSKFVLDSLPPSIRATRPCVVAEFGSPARSRPPEFRAAEKKLRVLFAGSMTQRKGLADVFAAMKLLKRDDVELIVMGAPVAPMEFYRKQFSAFTYEPPRPHADVLKLMESCDALVLPSIVEGRALVQQEAMSCGLPVIATANAGVHDLLEDARAGFLVPIRSPESIAERLTWMAENRSALPEMKRMAYEKSATLTWQSYTDKILAAIASVEGLDHA